jgi:hypothetical protein
MMFHFEIRPSDVTFNYSNIKGSLITTINEFYFAMFREVIKCVYIYFFNPTNALGCMHFILVYSNEENVSIIHVAAFRVVRTRR